MIRLLLILLFLWAMSCEAQTPDSVTISLRAANGAIQTIRQKKILDTLVFQQDGKIRFLDSLTASQGHIIQIQDSIESKYLDVVEGYKEEIRLTEKRGDLETKVAGKKGFRKGVAVGGGIGILILILVL